MKKQVVTSYYKLFRILYDRGISQRELCRRTGLSVYTIQKLQRGGCVNMNVLASICSALHCNFEDIMDYSVVEVTV